MKEIWKKIREFEDYEISNFGRVRSWKYKNPPKILRLVRVGQYGYLSVGLCNKTMTHKSVHRLVAESFLGFPPKGFVVNHLDGDRKNNLITNLEWCSQRDNIRKHYLKVHKEGSCGVCLRYKRHIEGLNIVNRLTTSLSPTK